ncbi:MAG TPA: flagellar motor protein MotA, partial [Thermoanaerobaculia bacterium]|nr:flagellar motor protein MotA [Thermoanaerobaculia bacterium]
MFTMALTLFQFGAQQGPGILRFFLQGGPMGKAILGLLVLFSLGSWAIIFGKLVHFNRADRQSEKFMEAFHRSQRFSEVNAVA